MKKVEQLRAALPSVESSLPGLQKHASGEMCGSCPKCGGEDRFIVYPEKDRFWCRQCDWKGDRIDLAIHLEGTDLKGLLQKHCLDDGNEYFTKRFSAAADCKPLSEHNAYLDKRGISGALPYLQRYRAIGFEAGCICFPMLVKGQVKGIQRVPTDGSKKLFVKHSNGKDGLLHLPGDGPVIVTEAAIDAISARISIECSAVATFSASTIDKLRGLKGEIVLFFDRDEAGGKATQKAAAILPGARAVDWSIAPAGMKDINDMLRAGHQETIPRMIEMARPVKVDPGIRSVTGFTAAELMATTFTEPRWAVPGVIPEGLSILGGKPKKGKSIIALNLCIAITSEELTT